MTIQIQDLKRSHDFLDILFSNINSALFIIDDALRVQEFNSSFLDMFGVIKDEVRGHLCGNVLGCVYTSENQVDCGNSAYCDACELRRAVMDALTEQTSAPEQVLERDFFIRGKFVRKYFQYACKPLRFEGRSLVLLIVDDVTEKEMRSQNLIRQNKLIREYNDRFREEMTLAKKIQKDLVPKDLPSDESVRFVARYVSMDEIGGDLYDVFQVDDDHIGFYLCDVTGHGVPAALITVMMKVIVEESAQLKGDPAKMVGHINEKLVDIFSDVYLTLFYGVYDKKNKRLTYVRAGHPEPMLFRGGGGGCLADEGNLLLGFQRHYDFKATTVQLQAGDRLLLFTDGVYEAKDKKGDMFESKLHGHLSTSADQSIEQIVDLVLQQLEAHVAKDAFDDDVCLLGIGLL